MSEQEQAARLRALVLAHEGERVATRLTTQVRDAVHTLRARLAQAPRLSQVRSLGNALAAQGQGDTPGLRLARLHGLVALQLERYAKENDRLPAKQLWQRCAQELERLRSGSPDAPGKVEEVWQNVGRRYAGLNWPTEPAAAQADEIHLRLAESFVHAWSEAWEYAEKLAEEGAS